MTEAVQTSVKHCRHGERGNISTWCQHPAITRGADVRTVKNSVCETCPHFSDGTLYQIETVDLGCVFRQDVSEHVTCQTCGGNRKLPVHGCSHENHENGCSPSDEVWNTLRANGVRVKRCTTCEHKTPPDLDQLAIIATHFNPCDYQRPRDNYIRWRNDNPQYRGLVVNAEVSFGNPLGNGAIAGTPLNVAFQKEALINRTAAMLPERIKYVAWVDPDLLFSNKQWAAQGIATLKTGHYAAVQLFEEVEFEDSHGSIADSSPGVIANYLATRNLNGAAGGAWMMQREHFESIGGLYPFMAVGGGDVTFVNAVLGHKIRHHYKQMSPAAADAAKAYIAQAHEQIPQRVGYVPGKVRHLWHGDKSDRQYATRQKILADFDPERDIKINADGILEWTDPKLAARVMEFFRGRKEDG